MDDCSLMAYVYRWLVWGSRNAHAQAPEMDRGTADGRTRAKMLRPARSGPREIEAAPAAGGASG
jgi:hypothetical protein